MRDMLKVRLHVITHIFVWVYTLMCIGYFFIALHYKIPVPIEHAALTIFGFVVAAWADEAAKRHHHRKTVESKIDTLFKDMDWVAECLDKCAVVDNETGTIKKSFFQRPEK